MTTPPTLIIGAGLAGLHLAWSLHLRGQSFTIYGLDRELPAWKASAGIINPVTGKRVVKSWHIDTLLPFARRRYDEVAHLTDTDSCFTHIGLKRYFRNQDDEPQRLRERLANPEYQQYLTRDGISEDGFEIREAAWVDVVRFVETSREYFANRGVFINTLLSYKDAQSWQSEYHGQVVFCEGAQGEKNPWFDWLDYRISRGDVLDFRCHAPLPDHIVNREHWVLPLGKTKGRMGSSYVWENLQAAPDLDIQQTLPTKMYDVVSPLIDAEIIEQRVGIRPGTNDSKPYAGRHPTDSSYLILNGFGSKGASQSPWCAEILANHLIDGEKIPAEVDVRRRVKFAAGRIQSPVFP